MSKLFINPPPKDKCCEYCGKHIEQLQAFDNGAKLMKTFRVMAPEMPEYEAILKELLFNEQGNNLVDLEAKYGLGKIENVLLYDQVHNTVSASWECIDCIKTDWDNKEIVAVEPITNLSYNQKCAYLIGNSIVHPDEPLDEWSEDEIDAAIHKYEEEHSANKDASSVSWEANNEVQR